MSDVLSGICALRHSASQHAEQVSAAGALSIDRYMYGCGSAAPLSAKGNFLLHVNADRSVLKLGSALVCCVLTQVSSKARNSPGCGGFASNGAARRLTLAGTHPPAP